MVEFAPPWEMINAAVEFWRKASPTDVNVPFSAGIPITIRDRDDCSSRHFHEAVIRLSCAVEVRRLPDRLVRISENTSPSQEISSVTTSDVRRSVAEVGCCVKEQM
ncbi:hypothetical protein [Saccharothrix luteola]|uniref:hypothetical protein n=1 Tax=Saccharothrix luteola TaxID=2893018 RepID=UPI001E577605|nr:hypothetical protein [Saccharothrix luteola]MCC8246740.1 hypothetical protein [Saccharothrix luteola]